MSVAFSSARPRSKGEVTQQTIQKVNKEREGGRRRDLMGFNIVAWVGACVSSACARGK